MSAPTTDRPTTTGGGGTGAVLALGLTEVKLLVRNRTAAFSALLMPALFGVFFAFQFSGNADGAGWNPWGLILALQLAFTFGLTVYATITQTVVGRRQSGVLKRLRTSSLTDNGILAALTGPALAVTAVHLVVFLVANPLLGAPAPADVLSLVLAVVAGLTLNVAAAYATAIVTSTAERAQITTMPLFMLAMGAGAACAAIPTDTPFALFTLLPGGAVGSFAGFAMDGGAFATGFLGLPAIVLPLVSLIAWPIVFAMLTRPRFKWDPRL